MNKVVAGSRANSRDVGLLLHSNAVSQPSRFGVESPAPSRALLQRLMNLV